MAVKKRISGLPGMWLVMVALVLGPALASPAATTAGPIEAFIDHKLGASGVPGLAYAVVSDGQITAVGGYGVVRKGGSTGVTADTPFLVGSVSKSFTALGIMQLVEAGSIRLDAPVAQYLRAFAGRPAGAVTIRQLLSHTSGFSTLQGNLSHSSAGGKDALARSVDQLAATVPAYTPGERWAYSNTNYQILGRVIEAVSGQEYQAYVTANILEPIGMSHSFVADGEVHGSMATGHRPWFGGKRTLAENSTDRVTAPQGGIVASAGDIARYMQVMMNGQSDVLSAAGKALMMRPAGPVTSFYGLGW